MVFGLNVLIILLISYCLMPLIYLNINGIIDLFWGLRPVCIIHWGWLFVIGSLVIGGPLIERGILLTSLAEGTQRLLFMHSSIVLQIRLAFRTDCIIIIECRGCLRMLHDIISERWSHINLLLLLLFKELFIVLRGLILGALAPLGRVSEFFICPLVLAGSGGTLVKAISTVLSGATGDLILDLKVSGNLRLNVLVSLGGLPDVSLIISIFLDLIYSFLEYVSKLPLDGHTDSSLGIRALLSHAHL